MKGFGCSEGVRAAGGLLWLENPQDEGIKVEVIFHVGFSLVRSKARVLVPRCATQGCLQPFEFAGISRKWVYTQVLSMDGGIRGWGEKGFPLTRD